MKQIEQWAVVVVMFLAGCRSKPEAATKASVDVPKEAAVAPAASGRTDAQATLDRLDTRTPVPLLPMMAHHQKRNMRDHLAAVQQIIAAVATKDFEAVEKAASRIGFSESMGQMCSHMGAGAPGFTDTALRFHHGADKIGDAARQRDTAAVLTSLSQTLSQCTGCHEQYKQQVVSESEWSARGSGAEPPQHSLD